MVLAFGSRGESYLCRVLLDSGSQCHFVTDRMANILGLRKHKIQSFITGIGEIPANASYIIACKFKSRVSDFCRNLKFVILPKITQPLSPTD